MDTRHKPVQPVRRKARSGRRKHTVAFKRRLVEQTLVPGASVARIARDNGVNAKLLFKWRRQHRRAAASTPSSLLPVILSEAQARADVPIGTPAVRMATGGGVIEVQLPAGRIRLKGAVDVATLRLVLQALVAAA